MAAIRIEPMTGAHLEEASTLLAARHREQRRRQPLLAARYEDPTAAAEELRALLATPTASGAAAFRGGAMVGYLVGVTRPDALWGPNVWVEPAGHAVTEAEVVRDLYAVLAAGWVEAGLTSQYAIVPAHDPALVDAWSRLSFGKQHAHGLCELPEPAPVDPRVRRAVRADVPRLGLLDVVLPRHQALSPVFSTAPVPAVEEQIADWEETFDDERFTTFVAELDGEVVGSAVGCSTDVSSLHRGLCAPENCGLLGFAAVLPGARGHGLGRALSEAVGQWAREAGFAGLVTDWRATNLLSSRTWPRLGYRISFERMHRSLA